MSKVTGITDKEKIRLRKTLWQMVDWLYIRGKITKEETERAHEEFDCLRWKDEEVERFLKGIKNKEEK